MRPGKKKTELSLVGPTGTGERLGMSSPMGLGPAGAGLDYWRRTRAVGLEAIEAWSTRARSTHAGECPFVSDERKQEAAGLAASVDLREEDGGG